MNPVPIPKRLNDPPKMMFWELDQAMVFMAALMLGITVEMTLTSMAVGLLAAWGYGKLKSGKHRGFAKHALYWYTPFVNGMRRTPPSHIREFLG
jgi:conjugal transfer pilus assembly protein TraL